MVSENDKPGKLTPGSAEHEKAIAENERVFGEHNVRREFANELNESDAYELVEPERQVLLEGAVDGRQYSDDELRDIVSFDDWLTSLGDTVLDFGDYIGSGAEFLLTDDLHRFVNGQPLGFIQWNFFRSKIDPRKIVAYVEVIDHRHDRYAFIVGTRTGILDDLAQTTMRTQTFHGAVAKEGLAFRSYPFKNPETGVETQVPVFSIMRSGKRRNQN